MKAAAALVAVAALPLGTVRPEFAQMSEELEAAIVAFRQARTASRLARPRILEAVRGDGLHAFFNAPEIRARVRARQIAQAAAERLFMPPAANDAEAALQERALSVFEELGGPPMREHFPTTRRLDRVAYAIYAADSMSVLALLSTSNMPNTEDAEADGSITRGIDS